MAKISFRKNRPPVDVPLSTPLMEALIKNGVPVASSCLGQGICSKCRIEIVSGGQNLSPETENEKELRLKNKITDSCRISCQTLVLGDITVDTTYW